MLNVARSSFYAWRCRIETPTAARRRLLAIEVRRVFDDAAARRNSPELLDHLPQVAV